MDTKCYCISLRKAERKLTSVYDDALKPVGVNVAQFSLLRTIEREGPVSLSKIGRLVELDRSTVGRNIKVLERMGVAKTIHGDDQREAVVELTVRGRHILNEGAPLWTQAQRLVEKKLGAAGAKQLRTLLQTL
ncbi:MarR family winged helix-turn-helix transcriptional regulator [Hyphomicrobium sp.]|uniref:MarR family winged helix-turn-helix transcriptional regulator n=1 Tax=Hyphomicrobium sp. TaxID=82 RepID=UPI002D778EE8|nr:MarR family transcriptional regulator [Hyphomicrobium sp.]HET6390648.1 MarR family transcriptional regulator [Hyphomicrobium sp.]